MTIRAFEAFARQLVERTGDAIIIADRQGTIVFWNDGAKEIFGYERDEAVGHSLEMIIPERLRERHRVGFFETMRTGKTSYADRLLAVPGIRKDASTVSLEFRVTLLTSNEGDQPAAIAAIIRDVTSQWEEVRALRDRVRLLEAEVRHVGT